MTQHNIAGTEAHHPSPHILVRVSRRARAPWHPAAKVFAAAGSIGAVASLIDAAIGAPVCLTMCCLGFIILWILPGN